MKKIFVDFLLIFFGSVFCFGCTKNDDVLRIHIRANSNSNIDQEVKLKVRDDVIDYITPLIASCNSSNEVKCILNSNLKQIENVADIVLKNNGFEYFSKATISNEYFPSRDYNGNIFPADYYDALILKLGSGLGDNWWCVAYPPLCFVGNEDGTQNVKYKSKILELINKYVG